MTIYRPEDFQRVIDEYNLLEKKEKHNTISKLIWVVLSLSAFSSLFLIFAIYVDQEIMAGFYISLILPGFALLALILVIAFHYSVKPLFAYLYDLAIKDILEDDALNLKITALPKEKDFIKDGGLFPLGSTRMTRYIIDYAEPNGVSTQIRDVYVATQSNRSSYVHIDGLYYIIKTDPGLLFQLRSSGSPRYKKGTMVKINIREGIREYCEPGKTIPDQYYELFNKLSIEGMKVNISGIQGELHVALHGYFNYRKIKKLDFDQFNGLKEYIRRLLRIADKICEISIK